MDQHSGRDAKLGLFRSLFRGREDVFARRFESRRTGRCGYAPVCANEWVRGVCEKPRVACARCPSRQFVPLTDEAVRQHLHGMDPNGHSCVMAVYPMLRDETCFFLVIDVPREQWQLNAEALMATCGDTGLPAVVERSRSGNGAHLWLFFGDRVPASEARKLGAHVVTETMGRRPELGFECYDRMFPNQDTLPNGSFGSPIALPLQGEARTCGNSLFVDRTLRPYDDQWAFLSGVRRLSLSANTSTVARAARGGRILDLPAVPESVKAMRRPWALAAARKPGGHSRERRPGRIIAELADRLYLPKDQLGPAMRDRLLRLAAFQNAAFDRAQAMRLSTYGKPRVVACAQESAEHIVLPRGCLPAVRKLFRGGSARLRVRDRRGTGAPIGVSFRGTLRRDQREAMQALLPHDTGVLVATTAFGKTVLAAAMIAERGVNALVLVHRRQLMDQWVGKLTTFLDIEDTEIGRLGGTRRKLKGTVDVALLQSIVRKGVVDERIADYGHVIIDECHHLAARRFEQAVSRATARYILGLSATVTRRDGHHPIIFMQCGPLRYHISATDHAGTKTLTKQVIVRATGFSPERGGMEAHSRSEFACLVGQLARDAERNSMICDDIEAAVSAGAYPLVLTERTGHMQRLADCLTTRGIHVVRLRGGMPKRDLERAVSAVMEASRNQGERRGAVVATGPFVGEGFDVPGLDSLFLALPVSWRGKVAQYIGRLHREQKGKNHIRVFDYADLDVPMLARMFDRRCETYRRQGYAILLPASARPGWPVEVPLPCRKTWKRTYSASVQRLLQDGVDAPLAELFAQVTDIEPMADRMGADRARSASEAFLFRRLESLPQMEGRFVLNARLPIPFGGQDSMEVDFLDATARVVMEVDGSQHFGDLGAYRRDRLKDYLLQENGYCVLRFLAEDLGTHLDHVLDTILRALSHEWVQHGPR